MMQSHNKNPELCPQHSIFVTIIIITVAGGVTPRKKLLIFIMSGARGAQSDFVPVIKCSLIAGAC